MKYLKPLFIISIITTCINITPVLAQTIPQNLPTGNVNDLSDTQIEQATTPIKSRLTKSNHAIGKGTSVQVSLGNIRSVKVMIVGEVEKPGTYTLPSLATVFDALYSAVGPNDNGSFRQIEVIRNNRVIRRLDVYDFIMKGEQKDNISLQDQDIIPVPTYPIRVDMYWACQRQSLPCSNRICANHIIKIT